MASAAIDFGVGRILTLLENEVLVQGGVNDEVEKMRTELLIMKSFLQDKAETKTTHLFQSFVSNTRDLVYEAESVIDEFAYHISDHRSRSRLGRMVRFPIYMRARRSVATNLDNLNDKIRALSESVRRYYGSENILRVPNDSNGDDTKWVKNLSETSLFFGEDSLVGINEGKEKLIGWLLDSEPQRTVVSVVGMGGSGKSTVAANVFKSQVVRRHFDCCAWITVSQSYVIEDVFRTMIKELYKEADLQTPADFYSLNYRELAETLVNFLKERRYIVVLDDVWSTRLWTEINVSLPEGTCGSRVMITTRNENVASFAYGKDCQIHRIEPLKDNEAWELFCRKSFRENSKQSRIPNIEGIARKLVQRCEGLPLAIVGLGCMMSTKLLESEWKHVDNTLNWELSNNPELRVVHGILSLSFKDLPHPLKHCFLYCCLFPEDYEIKRKRLIRMWIAQGFVEPRRGAKLEEVADSYLRELVYRNMLQVIRKNCLGRPKTFKMHDMMREIALSMSKAERFSDIYVDDENTVEDNGARHLCIQGEMRSGNRHSNLHTLLACYTVNREFVLPLGLKLLRVLDLENSPISKLPDSLGIMFNLKYLNLTRTQVRGLPKSFSRLLNLETLITKESNIKVLPPEISKLKNLQNLIAYHYLHKDAFGRPYLSGTSVGFDICKLRSLKVLYSINVQAGHIKNLGNLTRLTRLGLVNVKRVYGDDLCSSLNHIKGLRHLSLKSIDAEEPLKLDALVSTASIERLSLVGRLERTPGWFRSLHNLSILGLYWSKLEEDLVSHIQDLPNLVQLSLTDACRSSNVLCFMEGFRSLKVLVITGSPGLTEIVIQKGVMPGLEKLQIKECPEIESVPRGIESLVNLQELLLYYVSDQLVERINGEEREDYSRVKHIPAIKHYFMTENGLSFDFL
ncbi:PREDICTED: disease resistance protein RPM1-like [Tarenaya hassleriana]|uniref:disease resistance protein RPM1-like n=1 Tax=Tarenaya hassleriana TaxID=28532 RepID=UPI00053C499E|nr:PREDICTED: disease resistance protein RPM1-like [Tarenaya hassleriana]XP_010523650.1 PREDICTED: disease resistance protein RPM1-like [Tarenaya hassleriana]XP_010523652.1 PREDICTED: disease resistance protein RPM1-like [Tarenaya hassleriana]